MPHEPLQDRHDKTQRYCVDCVYATNTTDPDALSYWVCANPCWVLIDPVDATKTLQSCSYLRRCDACGPEARGYLSKFPPEPAPTSACAQEERLREKEDRWWQALRRRITGEQVQ